MAKLEMQGMSKYIEKLTDLAWASKYVCEAAVYAGADVVANEIRSGISKLKTVTNNRALASYKSKTPTYLSDIQKRGLEESLGIATMRNDYGVVHTRVGFDGYNEIETERWPIGQPNAMIARSCNSGTSAMLKQPFLRKAVYLARHPALKAMDEAANKKVEEIMEGKNG